MQQIAPVWRGECGEVVRKHCSVRELKDMLMLCPAFERKLHLPVLQLGLRKAGRPSQNSWQLPKTMQVGRGPRKEKSIILRLSHLFKVDTSTCSYSLSSIITQSGPWPLAHSMEVTRAWLFLEVDFIFYCIWFWLNCGFVSISSHSRTVHPGQRPEEKRQVNFWFISH